LRLVAREAAATSGSPAGSESESAHPEPARASLIAPAAQRGLAEIVTPGDAARALGRELGMTETIAEVLLRRGHADAERAKQFLEPRLADLTRPEKMADRGVAAARLARAVKEQELVCVYGDYDCDGITATAVLTLALRELGGRVTPLLASRFEGGYGVSRAAAQRIVGSGAKLLVTCDCGSSDHAVLRELGALGFEVIVIDHHLVPEEPLPALAFLNPHRPECEFEYKGLASVGLVLTLAAAIRSELGAQLDLRTFLDLVAIGTIADVAPLDGDNRILVRAGLERLRRAERPGVAALLELGRLAGEPLTAEDIAFRIAPRLNAPGRLGSPELALKLLLSRDSEEARSLAKQIEICSEERKALQERMLDEAYEDIERHGMRERATVVVGRPGWNHGIVGIVAGRLASDLNKPVVAIGFDDSGVGRGSVRGPRGSRLFDVLARLEPLLERFGGHQAAAGLEVKLDRLDALRDGFERAVGEVPAHEPALEDSAIWLSPADAPHRVLADLQRLEPCGPANPVPKLALEGQVVTARAVRGGHLKLELELEDGTRVSGFGPSLGNELGQLAGTVVVFGALRRDRWRGGTAVEVTVERVLAPRAALADGALADCNVESVGA
jgi:single-stranded-DNA-specific exonuclease